MFIIAMEEIATRSIVFGCLCTFAIGMPIWYAAYKPTADLTCNVTLKHTLCDMTMCYTGTNIVTRDEETMAVYTKDCHTSEVCLYMWEQSTMKKCDSNQAAYIAATVFFVVGGCNSVIGLLLTLCAAKRETFLLWSIFLRTVAWPRPDNRVVKYFEDKLVGCWQPHIPTQHGGPRQAQGSRARVHLPQPITIANKDGDNFWVLHAW